MLTYTSSLDSGPQEFGEIWKTFNIADYTDVIIRIEGVWDGPISFWADNTDILTAPLAVQDIGETTWTTAVISVTGATPSSAVKILRAPVAGLKRIGIYGDIYAEVPNQFIGNVDITVTAVSNTNAR